MSPPTEHRPVQFRILEYAEVIGGTAVSYKEAEQRRAFDPEIPPANGAKNRTFPLELMTESPCVHDLELTE